MELAFTTVTEKSTFVTEKSTWQPSATRLSHERTGVSAVNVTHDLSLLSLIGNASLLVKIVMAILLVMSCVSWWFIVRKAFAIRETERDTDTFEEGFIGANDLDALYKQVSSKRERGASLSRIFEAGFREFLKRRARLRDPLASVPLEATRRAMQATYQREMDRLENNLSVLATVGSVSPYIGLFGTVWGIMNSFRGLAITGQASLASVAPGIAEALIATAMGLFAAIPAVIAFNHLVRHLERLATRFETFMEEVTNTLQGEPAVPARGGE
jgi:biopolymer transport protein TolQ